MSTTLPERSIKKFYFNPELVRTRKNKQKEQTEVQVTQTQKETEEKEVTFLPTFREGTGYSGAIYTCPLTNVNFRGGCPIIPCHANITNYIPEKSCCLHIEANKAEFDKWDLQQYLDIKESKLYKYRERGESKVTAVILLTKVLSFLRENCRAEKPTKNIPEITNFINSSYLSLHEINPHLTDVILIRENLDKVREFLRSSGQNITLSELLGTSEPLPEG